MRAAPAQYGQAVIRRQRPEDVRRERRHLALREVDDAGRPMDQDDRERERAVDPARGEPRHDLLEECQPSVAEVALADGFVSRSSALEAGDRDLADLEHVCAVRGGERDLRVLLDDEDREALPARSARARCGRSRARRAARGRATARRASAVAAVTSARGRARASAARRRRAFPPAGRRARRSHGNHAPMRSTSAVDPLTAGVRAESKILA